MEKQLSDEEIYEEAKRRVKKKRDFYGHLGAYVIVNVILVIVWALSGRGYLWFLWPLGIWGVFVFVNFVQVFVFEARTDTGAIEKEAEKIRKKRD